LEPLSQDTERSSRSCSVLNMKFFCIGINHKTAPLYVREKFCLSEQSKKYLLMRIKDLPNVKGCSVLITCNRLELYISAKYSYILEKEIREILTYLSIIEIPFYMYKEQAALKHLFEVVCGLDSMILGETEIFGQVKKCYQHAVELNMVDSVLHNIFQKSFNIGKKIRTETNISKGNLSLGSISYNIMKQNFTDFKDKKVLIVGSGDVGKIVAKNFKYKNALLYITSKTQANANELAKEVNAKTIDFKSWKTFLTKIDVLIFCCDSSKHLLNVNNLKDKKTKLMVIDLGMPRNVDTMIKSLDNIVLYDMDDINKTLTHYKGTRKDDIKLCDIMIDKFITNNFI